MNIFGVYFFILRSFLINIYLLKIVIFLKQIIIELIVEIIKG
jgi:hypothetical protein